MGYSSELVQKVAGYMKVYIHTPHTHKHTHIQCSKESYGLKIQIRKSPAYRWKQRVWIKSSRRAQRNRTAGANIRRWVTPATKETEKRKPEKMKIM